MNGGATRLHDVTMKLPLRLMPRKIGAVFRSFFFLFFFGFAVFWTVMAARGVMTGGMESEPFSGFRYAFPAFGIPFLLIGLLGLGSAILKLLPGSPYHHVEISRQGLKVRRAWKIQQFAWPEISPFGLSVKTRSTKGGKVRTYWVVALRAADAALLADEQERYKRSVLQINTGDYVNIDVEPAASVLVDWLNGIRTEAVEHPARLAAVAVPPEFRDIARPIGPGQDGARATPANRSSVIER
jgi:hypothetical protein